LARVSDRGVGSTAWSQKVIGWCVHRTARRACSDSALDSRLDPRRPCRGRRRAAAAHIASRRGGLSARCESRTARTPSYGDELRPPMRIHIVIDPGVRSARSISAKVAQVVLPDKCAQRAICVFSTSARLLAAARQLPTCNEKSRICMCALQRASITSVSREIHSQTLG
jgi:hypothetical protein